MMSDDVLRRIIVFFFFRFVTFFKATKMRGNGFPRELTKRKKTKKNVFNKEEKIDLFKRSRISVMTIRVDEFVDFSEATLCIFTQKNVLLMQKRNLH